MKISKGWLKHAEIYKLFIDDFDKDLDFSKEAMQEMYEYETFGTGDLKIDIFVSRGKVNGYAVGKKKMDITIKMWKDNIRKGLLYPVELYKDKYPHWWLDKILKGRRC